MRKLIVNLPDAQMRALEESAKSKDMRPEKLVSEQLASLVSGPHGQVRVYIKPYARYDVPAKHHAYLVNYLAPYSGEVRQAAVAYHVSIRHPSAVRMASAIPGAKHTPERETNADRASADAERSRRRDILKQTSGIWKDREDASEDGVQYQLKARAEWD